MTRAELLLWPIANNWGDPRRSALLQHLGLCATLYPDDRTCEVWAEVVDGCRRSGKVIHTADAWIASAARRWQIPLMTTDFRNCAAIARLDIVPISS